MVYWHVEKNAACIFSQLKRVSSSEAAAMIQGVLRHCTEMEINRQYVDSHGQNAVAFAFCRLLGFELMPRLKGISRQRLYKVAAGQNFANLDPVMALRAINWELIEEQLDTMVKHAVALKLGMSDAESLLRWFTKNNAQHPAYKALTELGKAIKTISSAAIWLLRICAGRFTRIWIQGLTLMLLPQLNLRLVTRMLGLPLLLGQHAVLTMRLTHKHRFGILWAL